MGAGAIADINVRAKSSLYLESYTLSVGMGRSHAANIQRAMGIFIFITTTIVDGLYFSLASPLNCLLGLVLTAVTYCYRCSLVSVGGVAIMKMFASNAFAPFPFSEAEVSRIIEMAWEDRTPFEAIESGFGLSECDVILIMRRELKPCSFRLWRARVHNRKTKHLALRDPAVNRGYCPTQYKR